jgi:hypothetical protein
LQGLLFSEAHDIIVALFRLVVDNLNSVHSNSMDVTACLTYAGASKNKG